MAKVRIPTQQELDRIRESLSYNPETGVIVWLVGINSRAKQGNEAGCINKSTGYKVIRLNGRLYKAHRIAWYLHYNEWPEDQIDHINGIRDDNRITQLRVVTNQENGKNQKKSKKNTSGITGIYWHKARNKWRVQIWIDGKNNHLGYYEDFFEACCIRKSAEIKNGYHENHGRD